MARNGQARSSQGGRPACRSARNVGVSGFRDCQRASPVEGAGFYGARNGSATPDAVKRGSSRVKHIQGIKLAIGQDTRRRDCADPALGSLPGPNGRRIIDANGPVAFDYVPASFSHLPLQGIAGEGFGIRSLPDVSPEIFLAFGALAF